MEIRTGHVSQQIVAFAQSSETDLIVLGAKGRGAIADLLLGSVAQRVLTTATVPVLLVRWAGAQPRKKSFVCATNNAGYRKNDPWGVVAHPSPCRESGVVPVLADPSLGDVAELAGALGSGAWWR